MNNPPFYQESKNVDVLKLTTAYGIITLLALVLGYGYSVLISVIPLIYANFVLTFGFGLLLGLTNKVLVRLSHNRNRKSQIFLAVYSGLVANYFQWTAYVLYNFNGGYLPFTEYLSNLHWVVSPADLFRVITDINRVGLWSFMGMVFTGWSLTLIWILEAFIIGGIPVVLLLKSNVFPYSELLNKWYPKYTIANDFESLSMIRKFTGELSNDPINAIESLEKGNGLRHCKLHVYFLEHEEVQYLTFENIFYEGQGKGKKTATEMVSNFKIETAIAKELLKKYRYKRERIEII